jgi:hypothetical protein
MKTNWKIFGVILGLALLVAILATYLLSSDKEEYFNQVVLSGNNFIVNTTGNAKYYDTIVSVGLDVARIEGITLVFSDLSDAARINFGGDLKAHLRYFNGTYYIFVGALDREQAVEVLAHEIVHINQYLTQEFIYEDGIATWQGEEYSLEGPYEERPWEIDAYRRQEPLKAAILATLY